MSVIARRSRPVISVTTKLGITMKVSWVGSATAKKDS